MSTELPTYRRIRRTLDTSDFIAGIGLPMKGDDDNYQNFVVEPYDKFPGIPLNNPNLPPPGKAFMAAAIVLGDNTKMTKPLVKNKVCVQAGENLNKLYKEALYDRNFVLNVETKIGPRPARFIPGHLWFSPIATGPRKAKVMVVGRWPVEGEAAYGRNFCPELAQQEYAQGSSAKVMLEVFRQHFGPTSNYYLPAEGPLGYHNWYMTNVVRFWSPSGQKTVDAAWKKECLPLLFMDLWLVRPEFILCYGVEALEAFLGKGMSVTDTAGRVFDYEVPAITVPGFCKPAYTAKLMTCMNPAAVSYEPKNGSVFIDTMKRFSTLIHNRQTPEEKIKPKKDYATITTAEDLEKAIEEVHADPDGYMMAVDCEWHGETPDAENGYLRTIQFSHKKNTARCIVLYEDMAYEGDDWTKADDKVKPPVAFKPGLDKLKELLHKLFFHRPDGKKVRIIGHNFKADLQWLIPFGVDLRPLFEAPEDDPDLDTNPDALPGWAKTVFEGGFDTMLAMHAIEETAEFKLEVVCNRFLGVDRWDTEIQEAKKKWCKARGIKAKDLEGYGPFPGKILFPYSMSDVDEGRELFMFFNKEGGLLDQDTVGRCCRLPFWVTMRSNLAFLEMEMTGLLVDRKQVDKQVEVYSKVYSVLYERLRNLTNWKNFNINSSNMCRTVLFGPMMSGSRDRKTGTIRDLTIDKKTEFVRSKDEGIFTLQMMPIKTSGKPSQPWEKVLRRGEAKDKIPSTDKESLGILQAHAFQIFGGESHEFKIVETMRQLRFVGQTLKSVLARPKEDEKFLYYDEDTEEEEEVDEYEKGLCSFVQTDGRVHTHLYQTKETGRASSSRPPTQNLGSKREADLEQIVTSVGEIYQNPMRSIIRFRTDPWGHPVVGCEHDLSGAELLMMAVQSGDEKMIDHCQRNTLPDEGFDEKGNPDPKGKFPHPNYYDIHSSIAVQAFKLVVNSEKAAQALKLPIGAPCPKTKMGLKAIGKSNLRKAAKCVVAGSRLLTNRGWIRVEELCGHLKEDEAEQVNNSLSVVSDVGVTPVVGFYNGGRKPCVKVETEDGHSLTSTMSHKYRTVTEDGKVAWKEAGQLLPGDWVMVLDTECQSDPATQQELPLVEVAPRTNHKKLSLPTCMSEDWAAFLGLYVAEGSSNADSGTVQLTLATENDSEFGLRSEDLMRRLFGERVKRGEVSYTQYQDQISLRVHAVDLARWLDQNVPGDSRSKRVPEVVFKACFSHQAAFLRWLFEGDGSVKVNGRGFSVSYATASEGLARDVQILLSGFGIYTRLASEKRKGYDGTYWTVAVKYGESRERFCTYIGFVTKAKNLKCATTVSYTLDWSEIPNQDQHLRELFPVLRGVPREKCRECLREPHKVRLNKNRAALLLSHLRVTRSEVLSPFVDTAKTYLEEVVERPVRYVRVSSITPVGDQQVYDIQTTGEHAVCYNGLVTHQTVVFGIPYGRGDDAIVRAVEEEGVKITREESEQIRAAIFGEYPQLEPYLTACTRRVSNPGWMANCYQRMRRFQTCYDRASLSAMERQAMNFPIQSGVADYVSLALDKFFHFPGRFDEHGHPRFRLALQIHDAVLAEVRIADLAWWLEEVVPACMTKIPFYRCDLNGDRLSDKVYHMGCGKEIMRSWGIQLTREEGLALGIAEKYLPLE